MSSSKEKPSPIVLVTPERTFTGANEVFIKLGDELKFDLTKLPLAWELRRAEDPAPIPKPASRAEGMALLEGIHQQTSCDECGLRCWNCKGCGTGRGRTISREIK